MIIKERFNIEDVVRTIYDQCRNLNAGWGVFLPRFGSPEAREMTLMSYHMLNRYMVYPYPISHETSFNFWKLEAKNKYKWREAKDGIRHCPVARIDDRIGKEFHELPRYQKKITEICINTYRLYEDWLLEQAGLTEIKAIQREELKRLSIKEKDAHPVSFLKSSIRQINIHQKRKSEE